MPYSVGIWSPLEGSDMVPYGSPLGGYKSSQIEAIFYFNQFFSLVFF